MSILRYEDFLASAKVVADLRDALPDAFPLDCYGEVMPGIVYGDVNKGYIEGPDETGAYSLEIGRFGISAHDVRELVPSLYSWWIDEAAVGSDEDRAAAHMTAPANPYRDGSMSKGPSLQVSTDGGRTHHRVTEVRLSFGPLGEDDAPAEVLLTVTSEGVISDVLRNGAVVATDSVTFDELVARLTP